MPTLPNERVRRSRTFEFTGVDYLGPSTCKINGEKIKFWISLFTCLSTRAIHLEIILDLSASSFLHILRRFIALRGCPKKIISDNGTHFKAVADIIGANIKGNWNDKLIKNDDFRLNKFLLKKGIEWKFINVLSPWAGGFYERLVKLVKDAFKRSLGSTILNLEELKTFVKEVETAINCRPLTYVSTENDGILAIRPLDFLIPEVELNYFSAEDSDSDEFVLGKLSTAKQLQNRWKETQKIFNKFWENWVKNYLVTLRDKSGWNHQNGRSTILRQPEIGEIVNIQQEGQPRNTWPLGRILELDGNPVKSAKVKIGKKTLIRPINKLFPLEIGGEQEEIEIKQNKLIKDKKADKNLHPMITRSKAIALTIIQLFGLFTFGLALNGYPIRNCRDCRLRCTDKGVISFVNPYIRKIEICCMEKCVVNTEGRRSLHFQLPKE
uniref:Integrase catalytic domain-containing protein n=1 Tax=Meloidogyne incognita TaxID=6306 RepID=A0A914LY07_MELIC